MHMHGPEGIGSEEKSHATSLAGVVCEGPERAWFVSEYLYVGNLNLWIHGRPDTARGARL